jgi:hypothetical protein
VLAAGIIIEVILVVVNIPIWIKVHRNAKDFRSKGYTWLGNKKK